MFALTASTGLETHHPAVVDGVFGDEEMAKLGTVADVEPLDSDASTELIDAIRRFIEE